MKAVILAGGMGTRLRPLTYHTPKAMVPIANVPFLELFLSYLRYHGVDEAILALGHLPEAVERYFGDGRQFGIKVTPSIEMKPLGTAGAVKNAARLLDGPFLVFNGDVFTNIDLTAMARRHQNKRSLATLALTEVENPSAYGVLDIARGGRVRRFVEKPPPGREPSHLINAGVYILEPEVLDWIPDGRFSMFEKDVFPKLVEAGKPVYGYASRAYWIDIGTPDKYLAVNRDLVSGKVRPRWFKLAVTPVQGLLKCGVKVSGQVVIGKGTRVGKGVTLKGPAVIGSGCKIDENAFLDGVVVWDKVKIGEGAALKDCIIARNVCLGARCRIPEGCVIGADSKIDEERVLPEAQLIDPPGLQNART